MQFIPAKLDGAFVIELDRFEDSRGFFARAWCAREFAGKGLEARLVQASVSFNKARGTLRGMHLQIPPHRETKLVRCIRGAIWDVMVDLRPASKSFLRWQAVELTQDNRRALYIPEGFAHGFQTLEENTEIFYQMSAFHAPESARGFRWDDPGVGIEWPEGDRVLSPRDAALPFLDPELCAAWAGLESSEQPVTAKGEQL